MGKHHSDCVCVRERDKYNTQQKKKKLQKEKLGAGEKYSTNLILILPQKNNRF